MNPDIKTTELLTQLFEKYRLSGQNTTDYLEGLLVSNYEPYWKYIHLESLLSLQDPKTDFDDEMIFIIYHQITELYFKLILHELEISRKENCNSELLEENLRRINRYLKHLIQSFDIMTDGMRQDEFLKFRMALLPASGFQSYQFRLIEICLTPLQNLLSMDDRMMEIPANYADVYDMVYWKKGAIDLGTGEKTLTLKQFEKQYDEKLSQFANQLKENNLYAVYLKLKKNGEKTAAVAEEMRVLDTNMNINWRLAHYRSAVRYLHKMGGDVAATGGTNWQKFLPPRFQKVISFPDLWNEEELENWGKSWVDDQFK